MRYLSIGLMLACLSLPAWAVQADFTLRGQVRQQQASDSVLFPAEDGLALLGALDTSLEHKGLRLATTLWYEHRDEQNAYSLELSELFYDFSGASWQWSLGKKKLDWGLGYGFRPLDMFSPTSPLALYTAVAPGVWMASGDYFTEAGTFSLLCSQSQPDYAIADKPINPGLGCGGRYYHIGAEWEWQLLPHYDSQFKTRLGGSASRVVTDALEIHTSLLWQHRYSSPVFYPGHIEADYFVNPVVTEQKKGAWQALAGINYSTDSGINLIFEYWYDSRSPARAQWRELLDTATFQATHTEENPLYRHQLSAERQMFAAQNLFRHNLMLHLRLPGGRWRPELTLVANPEDGGLLASTEVQYYCATGHHLSLGARWYRGPAAAVYRQLDYGRTIYLGAELVF